MVLCKLPDITLSQGKRAYFLSDLHLGAKYFVDPHAAERRVVGYLDEVKDDAQVIFLVGDILDYWYEYRYVVPRGFVRFFGKLAELADSGIQIYWLIGNHDIWICDYLPSELGIHVIDGHVECCISGSQFYIAHGDDIDDQSRSFALLRKIFRNKVCQKLFGAIHPRWTVPFALGWSRKSRGESEYEGGTVSTNRLKQYASEYNKIHKTDYFIFGHLHIVADESLSEGGRMLVLGEWISRHSYAVYNGESLRLKDYFPRPE